MPITDDDTAQTLFAKLTAAAATLMREVYPRLCAGTAARLPQDHAAASYFGGRRPDDGRIDWAQSARTVFNLVRAVTHPYPGAFGSSDGRPLFVWEARQVPGATSAAAPGTVVAVQPELRVATGDGVLALRRVQAQGEAECAGSAWAAAHRIQEGARLT